MDGNRVIPAPEETIWTSVDRLVARRSASCAPTLAHSASACVRKQWPSSRSSTFSSSRSDGSTTFFLARACVAGIATTNGSSVIFAHASSSSSGTSARSPASSAPERSSSSTSSVFSSRNARRRRGYAAVTAGVTSGSRYGATVGMTPIRSVP